MQFNHLKRRGSNAALSRVHYRCHQGLLRMATGISNARSLGPLDTNLL